MGFFDHCPNTRSYQQGCKIYMVYHHENLIGPQRRTSTTAPIISFAEHGITAFQQSGCEGLNTGSVNLLKPDVLFFER